MCGICCQNKSLPCYCVDCTESLCVDCTKDHEKQKPDHITLPMAESRCPDHQKFYAVHCRMCDMPVCRECLTGFHNGHTCSNMNQAKAEKMHQVNRYKRDLSENVCSYQSSEDQGSKQLENYKSEINAVKMMINGQRERLKAMVDSQCDGMINSVETTLETHMDQLTGELSGIADCKRKIQEEILRCESLSGKGILEIKEFLETLPHLKDISDWPPALSRPVPSKFFPTETSSSEGALKQMIGNVVLVRIHNSFSCKLPVSNIQASSADEVWVSFPDEKLLTKYHYNKDKKTGEERETLKLDFKPECFLARKGDYLLASDRFNHCIWKIESKKKPQLFIKTSPNNPKGLCWNNRQELVVCVSGLTGSLRIYKNEKSYKEIGNHLLNAPSRVAQNGDENYIVLDDHLQSHDVVAINPKGHCKWKYNGSGDSKFNTFFPKSVCCDSLMNIILSDFGNNSIVLLDKNGKFLMNLLCSMYGIQSPQGICLDSEGKLWVGQGKDGLGECHIVQYVK